MGKRGSIAAGGRRTQGKSVAVSAHYLPPSSYLTPLAKDYWQLVITSFPVGYFIEADRVLLEQFCESAALHRNATITLQKEGRRYRDKNDVLRKNPAVDDQHQARCDCAMLATKLRLTKTSMLSPKAAGKAATTVDELGRMENTFEGLLYSEKNQEGMQ